MQTTRWKQRKTDTRLLVALLIAGACVTVFGLVMLAAGLRPYREAGQEYDNLRRAYSPAPATVAAAPAVIPTVTETAQAAPGPAEINPDYSGWLTVAGTDIDYPIVQGEDNSKYLTTTFEGTENKAGAIFMDYRCTDGLDAPHVILYGHNMNDGSMFGGLSRYLEDGYMEQHPEITVTQPEVGTLTYRIFAVRETDTADKAYTLAFADEDAFAAFAAELGAPEGTGRMLTLSTCGDGGGDSRMLVQAALVE
ncbi:MAG: class B sortase [Oscillospiraceae bacterium]|nr:class B sortase [Oscillospiraceae bacterium]